VKPKSKGLLPDLVLFEAQTGDKNPVTGIPIVQRHYAITSQFVTDNWQDLSSNSVIYIDACASAGVIIQPDGSQTENDFEQAVFNKHGSVYIGWAGAVQTEVTVKVATATALFVFDRLLGANQWLPESPPQRPFDYESVFRDLGTHTYFGLKLGEQGVGADQIFLTYAHNPNDGPTQFGLLAPSIAFMDADPPGQPNKLRIWGLLGNDQSQTTVTVGGQKLDNVSLNKGGGVLIADLPPSGPSSAGDVVVAARDHNSNVARVTKWQGTFRYTVAEAGTLSGETTFNLAFRGDIRKYRQAIHRDPVEPTAAMFQISSLSSAQFACNGTDVDPSTAPGVTVTDKYS
jgi:hypothetical protein